MRSSLIGSSGDLEKLHEGGIIAALSYEKTGMFRNVKKASQVERMVCMKAQRQENILARANNEMSLR